jgi:hypothetical protein
MKPNRYRYTTNKLYNYMLEKCNKQDIYISRLAENIDLIPQAIYDMNGSGRAISYHTFQALMEAFGIDDIAPLLKDYELWINLGKYKRDHPDHDWCNDVIIENSERKKENE